MTPTRRKKHKPEQIVAKLRDELAAERREGPGSGGRGGMKAETGETAQGP